MIRCLTFCGRHGTSLLAGGFFIGLVAPPLATLFRPVLGPSVFLLTAATMLGVDWRALGSHLVRPWRPALIVGWTMLGAPALTALVVHFLVPPAPLGTALVLWAAASPLIAVPAIAALLDLDPALALLIWAVGTFLTPLSLPPVVLGLAGVRLEIGMAQLMGNLALFVGGAALLATLARRVIGSERIARHRLAVSGLNVVLLLLFVVAVMDGMTRTLLAEPGQVLLNAGAAMVASAALQGVSFLVFFGLERRTALTAALIGGSHNFAIVWAALGPADESALLLFFAAVQLPIFVLPALLRPIYRRLNRRAPPRPRNISPGDG
jgi:bile acid:Na+ symporter, BASS family